MRYSHNVDAALVRCRWFWNLTGMDAVDDIRHHMTLNYCTQMTECRLTFQLQSSPCLRPETQSEMYDVKLMCAPLRSWLSGKQMKMTNKGSRVRQKGNFYYLSLHCLPKLTLPSAFFSLPRHGDGDGQHFALLRTLWYTGKNF